MSLKDVLDRTRIAGEAKRPPEVVATMHRAVDELRTPQTMGRILKVGDTMPAFALEGQSGIVRFGYPPRERAAGHNVLSRQVVTIL